MYAKQNQEKDIRKADFESRKQNLEKQILELTLKLNEDMKENQKQKMMEK